MSTNAVSQMFQSIWSGVWSFLQGPVMQLDGHQIPLWAFVAFWLVLTIGIRLLGIARDGEEA